MVVRGIEIYDGSPALITSYFVNTTGVTFPILTFGNAVAQIYGTYTSEFVVVGPDGAIKYFSRYFNQTELQSALDTLTDVPGGHIGAVPENFKLSQNYPNPFNPSTVIEYEIKLKGEAHVRLMIYDLLGNEITTLVDEHQNSGFYRKEWDGLDDSGTAAAAGIYFYRLTTAGKTETKRMVLMR